MAQCLIENSPFCYRNYSHISEVFFFQTKEQVGITFKNCASETFFPPSQDRTVRGANPANRLQLRAETSALFSLMLFFSFGNYPGGFEVLIRQCWLIPAVHNLCYYWMITRDKERETEWERGRAATLQCTYKHITINIYIFIQSIFPKPLWLHRGLH